MVFEIRIGALELDSAGLPTNTHTHTHIHRKANWIPLIKTFLDSDLQHNDERQDVLRGLF